MFRSRVYFAASGGDSTKDRELWRTDATAGGTRRIADIRRGDRSSEPAELTPANGKLFLAATTGRHGRELWRSDGTGAGTKLLIDINPGRGSSSPEHLTRVGDEVFFIAGDGRHGGELWRTDGTAAGTRRLTNLTAAPTFIEGTREYVHSPALTGVGGLLYFLAGADRTDGRPDPDEIWRSDGTRDGTFLVKDIDRAPFETSPLRFADVGGRAVFNARHSERGEELWVSRGTRTTTRVLTDVPSGMDPSNVCGTLDGVGYFGAEGYTETLYRTDGTPAGTRAVVDHPGAGVSQPCEWERYAGALYWTRSWNPVLWRTDGTAEGTTEVFRWADDNAIYDHETSGGLQYISAGYDSGSDNPDDYEAELWRSDGTTAGTYVVRDINPSGPSYPDLSGMAAVGG
jgi:ELWxxDGT repeat protein